MGVKRGDFLNRKCATNGQYGSSCGTGVDNGCTVVHESKLISGKKWPVSNEFRYILEEMWCALGCG